MSLVAFLAFVLPPWIVIGLATGITMGRRGHELLPWIALGVVMGPLAIPLGIEARRRRAEDKMLTPGRPGAGSVDVLVGIDGSEGSIAALRAIERLLGPRVGRLTLAHVLDYDEATSPEHELDEAAAAAALNEAAARVPGYDPGTVLLAGPPAKALIRHASEGGYGLLAIGQKGHGVTKAIIGSVAARLAAHPVVPVLIAEAKQVRTIDLRETERRRAAR